MQKRAKKKITNPQIRPEDGDNSEIPVEQGAGYTKESATKSMILLCELLKRERKTFRPGVEQHINNFIEPVIYFNPSIGISQIIGLDKDNSYVVASMKDESLYFFEYDYNDKKINTPNKVSNGKAENIKIERVHIGERIRDMIYYNDKLYLYLEDTASIAEVYIN